MTKTMQAGKVTWKIRLKSSIEQDVVYQPYSNISKMAMDQFLENIALIVCPSIRKSTRKVNNNSYSYNFHGMKLSFSKTFKKVPNWKHLPIIFKQLQKANKDT